MERKIGGIITNPGNSRQFKTGEWKVKCPKHLKEKCKNCMLCVLYCPERLYKTKRWCVK